MSRYARVQWTRLGLALCAASLVAAPVDAQTPGRLGVQFEYLQEFIMGEQQAPRTLISAVLAGGAAQRAGLRAGDIVQEINGMTPSHALIMHLGPELEAGDSVRIVVNRAGQTLDHWVIAETRPEGATPAGTVLGFTREDEVSAEWPQELRMRAEGPEGFTIVLNEGGQGRSFRYSVRSTDQSDLPFEAFVVRTPQTDSLVGLIHVVQTQLRTAPRRVDDSDRIAMRRAELARELEQLQRQLATVSRERLQLGNLTPEMGEVRVRVSSGVPLAPLMQANRAYFLGAEVTSVNGELGRYFKVDNGVLISSVPTGTPAQRVGLRAGDVIVGTDRGPVSDFAQLRMHLYQWAQLELRIVREGEAMTLRVQDLR